MYYYCMQTLYYDFSLRAFDIASYVDAEWCTLKVANAGAESSSEYEARV